METNQTETCPQCKNRGPHVVVMCGPKQPGSEELASRTTVESCDFCGGLGIVEVEVANRYRQGAALRKRRLRTFKLTQAQIPSRIAISPELLNAVEWGRTEMPAHAQRLLFKEFQLQWPLQQLDLQPT
jgi:hypothetical protein